MCAAGTLPGGCRTPEGRVQASTLFSPEELTEMRSRLPRILMSPQPPSANSKAPAPVSAATLRCAPHVLRCPPHLHTVRRSPYDPCGHLISFIACSKLHSHTDTTSFIHPYASSL
eukprot:361702-Chlamydomonas_euryale.AAC.2